MEIKTGVFGEHGPLGGRFPGQMSIFNGPCAFIGWRAPLMLFGRPVCLVSMTMKISTPRNTDKHPFVGVWRRGKYRTVLLSSSLRPPFAAFSCHPEEEVGAGYSGFAVVPSIGGSLAAQVAEDNGTHGPGLVPRAGLHIRPDISLRVQILYLRPPTS